MGSVNHRGKTGNLASRIDVMSQVERHQRENRLTLLQHLNDAPRAKNAIDLLEATDSKPTETRCWHNLNIPQIKESTTKILSRRGMMEDEAYLILRNA